MSAIGSGQDFRPAGRPDRNNTRYSTLRPFVLTAAPHLLACKYQKNLSMPTLTIQLPGLPPVAHVLKDETVTIGRFKGNTIVIEDASISLMHAKITRKDGQFYLKDLNSTNGTIVNGQPIGEVRL